MDGGRRADIPDRREERGEGVDAGLLVEAWGVAREAAEGEEEDGVDGVEGVEGVEGGSAACGLLSPVPLLPVSLSVLKK
jgi:hypothetical protein